MKLGPERAVLALSRSLQRGSSDTRPNAARLLGAIGADATVDLLIEAASDLDEQMAYGAVCGLAQSGKRRAAPALIGALRSGHPWIREAAACGLGSARDANAVPALIAALKDEHKDVRALAAQSLGHLAAAAAVPTSGCRRRPRVDCSNRRPTGPDSHHQLNLNLLPELPLHSRRAPRSKK